MYKIGKFKESKMSGFHSSNKAKHGGES